MCSQCLVDVWAERQPQARWARLTVRDGERGPLRVDAMVVRVRTKLDRRNGPEERLVVLRTVEAEPKTHSALSNAGAGVPLEELVRARFARHQVEEVFEAAQQEAGLAHSEVRSWVGWHHPVTLSLVAWSSRLRLRSTLRRTIHSSHLSLPAPLAQFTIGLRTDYSSDETRS